MSENISSETNESDMLSKPLQSKPGKWFVSLSAALLLWTIAIFFAQSQYIVVSYWQEYMEIKIAVRAGLNFLFAVAALLLLPRWASISIVSVGYLCAIGLATFANYFDDTMSVITLFANFDEGAAVTDAIVALLPLGTVVLLFFANLAVILLLCFAGKPSVSYRCRAGFGMLALFLYLGVLFGFNSFPELSFTRIQSRKGTGDLAAMYGLIPVWGGELFCKNNDELLRVALAQPSTDRLTPLETRLELPRQVVVLQIETLDFAVIGRKMNGKTVTPNFNRMKEKSFFYKVDSFHYNGSADADFAMLNAREPSPHILNYKIHGFPYENTLPQAFNEHGYKTYSFHNANGSFFARLPAYRKMGIENIFFIEEIVKKYDIPKDELRTFNGLDCVYDDQLFKILSQAIHEEKEKSFFFAITLDTHAPYVIVKEKDIFSEPAGMLQRYANSIHHVDKAFGTFYDSLPEGTLLVVYGDHGTSIREGDYVARERGEKDYVPCMISVIGQSIAERQKADPVFALGGELSLVDVANYIRSLLKPSDN